MVYYLAQSWILVKTRYLAQPRGLRMFWLLYFVYME